jgi:hypothetical protein
MFIDLLPGRSDVLDLSGFDILSLHAVRLDRLGVQRIEVKLETKSGGQYTQFIMLEDAWARYTLSLADFAAAQNWSRLAKDVSRVAITAVNMEGSSQTVSAAVGGFAVHRKPVLSLTVLGTGTVTVPEVGLTSDSVGWSAVERGTTLELIVTPAEGFRFLGWSGDEDCLDSLVSLEDDITCTAIFALENH